MTGSADWIIEPVGSESAEMLADLHKEAFSDPWSPDDFTRFLALPNHVAWLAVHRYDGTPGAALGFLLANLLSDPTEILTLAVAPASRRRGVGRMLVRKFQQSSKTLGVEAAILEVASDNSVAQSLYQSCGFRRIARREGYYRRKGMKPVDALILEWRPFRSSH